MAKEVLFNIRVDAKFTAIVQLEKQLVGLIKRRKQLIKLSKTENGITARQQKELTALNITISQQTKEKNKLTKEIQKGSTARQKELSQLDKEIRLSRRLQKELKNVILTKGATSKEARRLSKRLQTLNSRMNKVNVAAKKMGTGVSSARGRFGGLTASLGKAAIAASGAVGGILALVGVVTGAISIIRNFQQENANLASILSSATKPELDALSESAKQLGASTAFSATEVVQLQTEFAKLGFSAKQIEAAQAATLSLAAAVGTDLANAATVAGATLGGFGLEARDTQRVTDVMAKSFSISALDIGKFQESMKTAAPAARAVGIELEETTALLGTLAKAGISGSKAGTSLATSFINLNSKGLNLQQGLDKVNNSSNKLQTAVDLVGKEAAKAFLVLAEGTETTAEFTESLLDSAGAAEAMAKIQLDTLNGSIKILNSSWEGLILSMEDGSGVMANISKVVLQDLSKGLGILSGENKKAKKEFSLFGIVLTAIKTSFKILAGGVKIFLAPLKVLFDLIGGIGRFAGRIFTKLGNSILEFANKFEFLGNIISFISDKFKPLLEAIKSVSNEVASFTEIINNLPEIVDIIVEEIIESFGRIVDVAKGIAIIFENLFKIPPDLEQMKRGLAVATFAIANAFDDITGDIADRVGDLFKEKGGIFNSILDDINNLGDKAGEELGDSIAKGISKGLIEQQSKIISDLQKSITEATTEQEIIVLKAKLEFEKDELKRLQELGQEIELINARSTGDLINALRLEKKKEGDLAREKANEEHNQKLKEADLARRKEFEEHNQELKTTAGIFIEENAKLLKDSALKVSQEISDTVFDQQKQANERRKQFEIGQLTITDQRERDVLQSRLDSGLISQAEFESNRLALEQRTAEERTRIEREAFERKKDIDTAQAIINGALAITQSLANTALPFPASLVGPIAIAASTALQVATIRSQKFGGGGVSKSGGLLQGRSHQQGGIPAIVGGSTPIEMEGGEAVINKNATRKHLSLLSAINQDGGGVPLMARGGLTVPKIKYQGGGVTAIDPIDLRNIVQEVTAGVVTTIRVENVATETVGTALEVQNLQSGLSN